MSDNKYIQVGNQVKFYTNSEIHPEEFPRSKLETMWGKVVRVVDGDTVENSIFTIMPEKRFIDSEFILRTAAEILEYR